MFPLKPLSLRTTEEVRQHLLPQWQRWLSFEFQRLRSKELWKRSVGSHFQNRVSLRHTLSSMWLSMHFVTIALRQLPVCSGRCYLYKGTREPSYRVKSTDGSHRTYWWRIQGDHRYIVADAETKESWISFIRSFVARGRRNDGDGAFHLNAQGVYVPQTTLGDLARR